MDSFGKLYGEDADHLAEMFASFPSKVRNRYTALTLRLWSHLRSRDGGEPYVTTGRKTLAKECGVSERVAQCYFEFMEREGYLEAIGTRRDSSGQYTARVFWWHVGRGERGHVQRVNVKPVSDVHGGERETSIPRSPSDTECQNGRSALAPEGARVAPPSMWVAEPGYDGWEDEEMPWGDDAV